MNLHKQPHETASVADGIVIGDPWEDVSDTSEWWKRLSEADRIECINSRWPDLTVVSATSRGDVTVRIDARKSAEERGGYLRCLEAQMKLIVDAGIVVYLEAVADRNYLRRLRGVSSEAQA
jgi:hypothetical protein